MRISDSQTFVETIALGSPTPVPRQTPCASELNSPNATLDIHHYLSLHGILWENGSVHHYLLHVWLGLLNLGDLSSMLSAFMQGWQDTIFYAALLELAGLLSLFPL